jgi:membrane-bound lytic murein transglycosylase B
LPSALCPSPFQDPPPATAFEDWLIELRKEALARGISAVTIEQALTNLTPEEIILTRDRTQPELVQSLDVYVRQRLNRKTVGTAQVKARQHAALLARVRAAYGVSAPMMIAIWGLESNFGQFTGVRPTVMALATLAFDSRRSTLFRSELFDALTIVDRGLIPLDELKGSWAGAMGQPQFMPSSYLRHAVDFDRDGRADIWRSHDDVFASIANYLKAAGWTAGERWGREVRIGRAALADIERTVPMRTTGCRARREMTEFRPMEYWREIGLTLAGGAPLPRTSIHASLVRGEKRHFLVYRNYDALLDYNCSNSYAVSVGLLADRIR